MLKEFFPSVMAAATHYMQKTHIPVEILIIDDGSEDGTAEWLQSRGFRAANDFNIQENSNCTATSRDDGSPEVSDDGVPELLFLRNQSNIGFGPTCNRGFAAARYPLAFLLNNDVQLDLTCIAPLVEHFSDPEIFAAHCRVFEFDSGRECGTGKLGSFSRGFIRVHGSYISIPAETGAVTEPSISNDDATDGKLYSMFASGGSAMFRRETFIEIGSFEPLLSPNYWEDVDISYRAWKRGFTVIFEPLSVARHRVSATMRKLNQRRVRRIQQRNRLIYHWINLHDRPKMLSHVGWVILLAITAPLRLQPGFLISTIGALRRLPAILLRRREERLAAKRTDRQVLDIFESLLLRSDIAVYENNRELERLRAVYIDNA